jgi:hypothetical protein
LSPDSFVVLQNLVVRAAVNLERFNRRHAVSFHEEAARPLLMMAMTDFTLEEIASDDADARLAGKVERRLESSRAAASQGA